MNPTTIGVLHPGEMGAAIGAQLVAAGHRVLWASEGRSAESADRARAAGLTEVATVAMIAASAEVVLSICPPSAAADTARAVGSYRGLYVDANAIAPATTRRLGESVRHHGGRFVDGGIIGRPPRTAGDARFYLSGPSADEVAALFGGTVLDVRVVDERIGAASAVKVAYAAWTKATMALLLTAHEFAEREGVGPTLEAEWALSQPALAPRLLDARRSAETKGWRWIGEMQEIAAAFAAVGLPAGFHETAAEVYRGDRAPSEPA